MLLPPVAAGLPACVPGTDALAVAVPVVVEASLPGVPPPW